MIESRDPETWLPVYIGQEVPKPGSNFWPQIPKDFIAPPARWGHQSPLADEYVAVIAGGAMQVITWE